MEFGSGDKATSMLGKTYSAHSRQSPEVASVLSPPREHSGQGMGMHH
jgi:hypothetical protein